MTRHRHHIVPIHDGGTNDKSNITPPISMRLHAAFHYDRWKALGQPEDWIACMSLLRQISGAEAAHLARVASGRRVGPMSKGARRIFSASHRAALSISHMGQKWTLESRAKASATKRGQPRYPLMTDALRIKIRETQLANAARNASGPKVKVAARSGRTHKSPTTETRAKIAASLKGHPFFRRGDHWLRRKADA